MSSKNKQKELTTGLSLLTETLLNYTKTKSSSASEEKKKTNTKKEDYVLHSSADVQSSNLFTYTY